MFKKQRKLYIGIILLNFILAFIFVSFFTNSVLAEDGPLLIEKDIILKNGCEVKDTNEETIIFPKTDSGSVFLGICVLAVAMEQGLINDFKVINDPNLGLYVQSVNGIEPGSTEFWGLWQNGGFANCGIGCITISEGDTLSLILTDWMAETESTRIVFHITELVSSLELDVTPPLILLTGSNSINLDVGGIYTEPGATATDNVDVSVAVVISGSVDTTTAGTYTIHYNATDVAGNHAKEVTRTVNVNTVPSGGGGGNPQPDLKTFNIQNALKYLQGVQSSDGSFDNKSDRYTDWVAIAAAAGENSSLKSSISNYIRNNPLDSSVAIENERRAMALLALGINPYSGTEINYIKKIINSFDGTQFDTNFINDDVFALVVLANAGYTASDDIIIKDVAFLISEQDSDGSWFDSVDITAAAIQALKPFESVSGVSGALTKATSYLVSEQNNDGGWNNSIFSTSWAIQAMKALNASWTKNGKSGLDYLATQQATDGSVSPSSDTYATSSAIAAASGKPWSEIMQSVEKPVAPDNSNNNSTQGNISENTNPITPVAPVVCLKGDLFSAITGQVCTAFVATDSTNPLSAKPKINPTPKPKITKTKKAVEPESPPNTDTPEINPNPLSAIAANALPNNSIPQNIPIALGTVSGIILLYAALKKFLIL